MCIRDSGSGVQVSDTNHSPLSSWNLGKLRLKEGKMKWAYTVSYTHLRAHETVLDLVCRLLLEKKKNIVHMIAFSFYTLTENIHIL